MKTIIAGICFVAGFSFAATAQDGASKSERYPHHIISKDVQRLQFRNAEYKPARITTGDLNAVSSKGIARVVAKSSSHTYTNVQMKGMPSHVISKGVARMQYERK